MSSGRDDPHGPLRDDVRTLGRLLGETLQAQQGAALLETVERVRTLSKAHRDGDEASGDELVDLLSSLPVGQAHQVARAFAQFLAQTNIAEQHHRVRRRRQYRRDPDQPPQRGSFEAAFGELLAAGVGQDTLHEAVCGLHIEPVFTAHPTEVVRRTVLQKHNRIARLLARRDREDLTPRERDEADQALAREVVAIWRTDELRRGRPTPTEEARSGLAVVEQVLWDVVPELVRELDQDLRAHTGRGLPLETAPVTLGSWMGGDRDGNPNVTPAVTRDVVAMARWTACTLYLDEVRALREELSMTTCTDAVRAHLDDPTAPEPYRALLGSVRARLEATRELAEAHLVGRETPTLDHDPYEGADELRAVLTACHRSLVETGAQQIADGRLTDLIRRVVAFGLHLARVDLRQEAALHTRTLDQLTRAVGLGAYGELDEHERQAFLARELASARPLVPRGLDADEGVQDVLATFRMAAELDRDALGAYVISMATAPSDVLAVELLQREAGVSPPLPVVPLFETLDDLRGAGDAMDALLSVDVYREHLAVHHGDRQQVMIGYSDSAKDAGILTAGWALYQAQEDIVAACRDHGVEVVLFHGRGGTVGRGGAPAHAAIRALPPASVGRTFRVTEQGEVIHARFGLPGIAKRTLELYVTGVLQASLDPPEPPSPAWRATMDELAEAALKGYRGVVHEDERFVDYFHAATPIDELAELNIGSRPASRPDGGADAATDDSAGKASQGVESLRAIPWVFAWNQDRLILPGWLGVGEALEAALAGDDAARERTAEMARQWPFLAAYLDMVEMVLAKVEPSIAAHYDAVLVPDRLRGLGDELRAGYGRARKHLLQLVGRDELLEGNPVLRRSIGLRNPYVDPLNLLQVELLRRVRAQRRAGDEPGPELVDALMVTINGVAAGLRNTG